MYVVVNTADRTIETIFMLPSRKFRCRAVHFHACRLFFNNTHRQYELCLSSTALEPRRSSTVVQGRTVVRNNQPTDRCHHSITTDRSIALPPKIWVRALVTTMFQTSINSTGTVKCFFFFRPRQAGFFDVVCSAKVW